MKVLSVRQPWAWALIHGGKDVENRNWRTNYRGRLAIHAGKAFDIPKHEFGLMLNGEFGEPYTQMAIDYTGVAWEPNPPKMRGAIIGTVELYDCIHEKLCDSPWKDTGDDFYCWLVRNPVALREPIPMKGRLGLWDVPDEWLEEVGA